MLALRKNLNLTYYTVLLQSQTQIFIMYMNKPIQPEQKQNFQTDQEECKRSGYILSQKFLGKGAYARVYAGTPTKETWRNNYKLKALSPNDHNFNVCLSFSSS